MVGEAQQGGEMVGKTEKERKWVIDRLPDDLDLSRCEAVEIRQGYLANDTRGAVRVRQKGAAFFQTWKGITGEGGIERREIEEPITEGFFEAFWPGTQGRRVEKTRYKIPIDKQLVVELDVFAGAHKGHVIAEVEFPDMAAAHAFQALDWFGKEVTHDKRFGNASIADHGFPVE